MSRSTAAGAASWLVAMVLALCWPGDVHGAPASSEEANAAQRAPLSIGIFVSSREDACFEPGDVPAIKRFAETEQDRINRQGGIAGRKVELRFFDDQRDAARSIANMRAALADAQMLAMIGLANSTRAKAAFDALGREIGDSSVPFLSDISVNSIFADHANVFTMRASQEDERLPVLVEFVKQMNFKRPAFLGLKDILFSTTLGDGLKTDLVGTSLVADVRLRLEDSKLDESEVAAAVGTLKDAQPDLLFVTIGSSRTAPVLKQLMAAGIAPVLFVTGRIESIAADLSSPYPNDIYQVAWGALPDAYNDRLRKLISRSRPEDWLFEGSKNSEAPGWRTGECKPRIDEVGPTPLDSANLRAIGIGTRYGDMVALIGAAARSADPRANVAQLRSHVLGKLKSSYASGRGTFQGSFENWSFRPGSRAAARTPLIVMLVQGMDRPQLAPFQFIRLRDDSLRRIDTLYLDIDLIRATRVDDNEKTFFAEFYLSMRDSNEASIERIEFTNAFLDPRTNDRQITVRTLHNGGKSDTYPNDTKIYQVSGKFLFDPQLANYPFDTQRFAINVQPKLSGAPFVVQPPPHALRDGAVTTDGWDLMEHYVGYDEDFVATVDARTHEHSVVPFYKASFVWLMKRQTTDYYLRVVVPLAFILIIAYMSIFIPQSHFEAIVTIQVTALLSAVALYLALPKVDSDTATLSDRIFLFDYMAVSLMITVSIMRVSHHVVTRRWLKGALGFMHIVLIPALVGAMAVYVYQASLSEGF